MSKKITLIGGGVLGVQIGLMCAYTGHDTTFWLRSEGSIGRTQPKIDLYSEWMLSDLEAAKQLIGNPMGKFLYAKGLIKDWDGITAEAIDGLIAQAKENFAKLIHIELDMAKAVEDADFVIEAMAEDPAQKISQAILAQTQYRLETSRFSTPAGRCISSINKT